MAVDVVICNLTRLGDLLQTQPLINDLHEAGYGVGLVCQENFASAIPLLRNVRQSWTMPGAKFLSSLDKSWPVALKDVLAFGKSVSEQAKARYIINLTPTLPARLLAKLLAADAELLGFGLDDFGYGLNEGVWSSFISVAARQRINAPFNVADMLRRLAFPLTGKRGGDYLLAEPAAETLKWAEDFLSPLADKACSFVAFQPGASSDFRRWPVENFKKLGQALWDKAKIVPVLLGSPNEKALADEYGTDAGHPWINAIGHTKLPQAAALLKKCRLLVSNDTGTMHLAAGQNVPVLAFFLATAQPWDTGPLRPGSCCLEARMDCHPCSFTTKCEHRGCRDVISAQSAEDLILAWLENGQWASGVTERVNRECRVWLTGRDEDGFASLELLNTGETGMRQLWLPRLRHFWRQLLDDIENPDRPGTAGDDIRFPPLPENTGGNLAPILAQSADILDSIYDCGEMLVKNPMASKLFLKNCSRLQSLLDAAPLLSTLAAFWQEFRINQGNDLPIFLPAVRRMALRTREFAHSLATAQEEH